MSRESKMEEIKFYMCTDYRHDNPNKEYKTIEVYVGAKMVASGLSDMEEAFVIINSCLEE